MNLLLYYFYQYVPQQQVPPAIISTNGIYMFILLLIVAAMFGLYLRSVAELRKVYNERLADKDKIIDKLELMVTQRDGTLEEVLNRITPLLRESTGMVKTLYTFITSQNK